ARLLSGDPLGKLMTDMARYAELMDQLRQPLVKGWHLIYEQTVFNLYRGGADPCVFAGPSFDEASQREGHVAAGDHPALFNLNACKALICYLFGQLDDAAASARANEPFRVFADMTMWAAPWACLDSLCRLAVYDGADRDERARILAAVDANQARLSLGVPHCP